MSCVAPTGAFYAMPKVDLPPGRTDEDYVLALLRETGVLCVYGSGFGTKPEDGFFRVVFLASTRRNWRRSTTRWRSSPRSTWGGETTRMGPVPLATTPTGCRSDVPASAAGATVARTRVIALPSRGRWRRALRRDIPWDLGDSVLNCWILQWGADHWLRFLGGDLGAFRGYFNANIFYPEPLTLAYSEHLTAQVLQILPVYALTRQHRPLVQPAVPLDVRAVGPRHVPARARAHGQRARRVRGRACSTRSRRTASASSRTCR